MEILKADIKEIKTALLGSEFNGKKGALYVLESLENRVEAIEKKHEEEEIYKKQRNWVIGIFGAGVGSFLIYIAKKIGI